MTPQKFNESNRVLRAPKGMDGKCGDLYVFSDGEVCVSQWQPTEEEKAAIAAGAPIWLRVVSGDTQPPVGLSVSSPFIQEQPAV